ncbi:hydrogenase membrane subunit [Candidatus Woesearchaeota archaeon]|nr:hydrogenase membrane subunit [Candidatus Woesearchaeota archaeon]
MMLLIYVLIGLAALAFIIMSRSYKLMNFFSLLHSGSYMVLGLYILSFKQLPIYYTSKNYFFMDNFGLYQATIASLIFFLASLYLDGYIWSLIRLKELNPKNIKLFYAAMNLLLIATILAFFSNNLAVFWIALESTTLFAAVLIVILNAKENIEAALNYLFVASPAMLFSFIGLILLYSATQASLKGTLDWNVLIESTKNTAASSLSSLPGPSSAYLLSPKLLSAAFIFIFIGFASKSGIVPFHAWLPSAYAKAPSPVSVVLSAVVSSISIYGIIRVFSLLVHSPAVNSISWFLIVFGVITIAVASFNMVRKTNVKRIIAFSSIEHMGIILVGIGIATRASIYWTIFYMLVHSLIKALLFFSAGVINSQYGSNDINSIKDLIKLQPLASLGLIIGSIAIIGMPPFALFLPKLMIFIEASKFSLGLFFIIIMLVLVAICAFGMFMTQLFSSVSESNAQEKIERYIMPVEMKLPIIILVVLILVLGLVIPQEIQQVLNNIVGELGL